MFYLYIVQLASLLLTIPSLFLYSLECWYIYRGRNNKYGGSFYRIFLLAAVNNIVINFPLTLATIRATSISALFDLLASLPSWSARFFFALYYYNLHVESLLTLLILIHRLSAIVRPFDYEKVWKKFLPSLSVLTFICPLIFVYHIFFIEVRWYPYTIGGEKLIGLDYNHKAYPNAPRNSKLTFIISSIFLALCLLVNCCILAAYKRVNVQHGAINEQQATIEFRLMAYSILTFLTQAFVSIFWILIYLFQFDDNFLVIKIMEHYILLNDARAFVLPSWFLLWASSDIRANVAKFVRCFVPSTTTTGGSTTNGANPATGGSPINGATAMMMINVVAGPNPAPLQKQKIVPIKSGIKSEAAMLSFLKRIVKLSLFFNGISWDNDDVGSGAKTDGTGTSATSILPRALDVVRAIGTESANDFLWWASMMMVNNETASNRALFAHMVDKTRAQCEQFKKRFDGLMQNLRETKHFEKMNSCVSIWPTLHSFYLYQQMFNQLKHVHVRGNAAAVMTSEYYLLIFWIASVTDALGSQIKMYASQNECLEMVQLLTNKH